MEKLINQPPDQLTIIFPLSEAINESPLKSKCEQLGVNTDSKNSRPISYYFSEEDSDKPEMVTEKMLKDWVNAQGISTVFNSKAAYENWERLLYSEHQENFLLALSILNTPKRPEDKFFALLLAVAINHNNERMKEMATRFISPYLTTKEWKQYSKTKYVNLVFFKFSENKKVKPFIDINYYQFWAKSICKSNSFFSQSETALSSNHIEEIIKHPSFLKWIQTDINFLKFRIEKGGDLTGLYYLVETFNISKRIEISAVEPYTLKSNELSYLDCEFLTLKNINPPIDLKNCVPLKRIKNIAWDYGTDIYFLDDIFPNLIGFNLAGNNVKTLALHQIKKQIQVAQLTLRTQHEVPPIIYDCSEMTSLHIHDSQIKAFGPAIIKLQKLTSLCIEDTMVEEFPTDFFRLPNVEFMYGISTSKEIIDFRADCQYYGPNRLYFRNDKVKFFPYGLAQLKGLNELYFEKTDIQVIDERILNFKLLKKLSFEDHQLTTIPDLFQRLENLQELYLYSGKIASISFDWINHVNQQGIKLSLSQNLIKWLPPIPDNFDMEQVIKNNGYITFTKYTLLEEQVEQYKTIFGEDFIKLY